MKTRNLLLPLLSSLVVACSSTPSQDQITTETPGIESRQAQPSPIEPDYQVFNPAEADSQDVALWLQQALSAAPLAAAELRLRAAAVLLRDGEPGKADSAISPLVLPELSPEHAIRLSIIQARIFRYYSKMTDALATLADPLVNNYLFSAPAHLQIQFSQLRASLFSIEGQLLAATRERIFLHPLLNDEQAEANAEQIWQMLLQIPQQALLNNINSAADTDYLGWLELALIAKTHPGNLEAQIQGRNQWLQRWPAHPARQGMSLPGELHKLEELALNRAEQVALLLPVSGKLARFGKAVRNGYLAASFEAKQSGNPVPLLRVYDSASGEINQLYQQAVNDGADIVFGPLSKDKFSELVEQQGRRMVKPTFALNRIDGERFPRGLYQLSLSPEDEAVQIAEIARRKGYQRAMIISPAGSWGNKVAEAFDHHWQQLGGTTVATTHFNAAANDYSKKIKAVMQLDRSEARRAKLRQITGLRAQFEPHRRRDIDFIFLVARPREGRAIIPLLAYHYASELPVLSTSHIYPGSDNKTRDRDINNVLFVDIPWVLNEQNPLRDKVLKDFPGTEALQRMYALGVDSFHLNLRLNQLQGPGSQIFGATGTLSLNPLRQIERQLSPAIIANGRALLVDTTSPETER